VLPDGPDRREISWSRRTARLNPAFSVAAATDDTARLDQSSKSVRSVKRGSVAREGTREEPGGERRDGHRECDLRETPRPVVVVGETDDVDAVTQSIEFARCSNATAFILPFLGHNFGVGEEAGSILEALSETHGDRLVFVHEDDVTSAMIRAANARWDLRVETYETEAELVDTLRRFAAGIMHRERRGDLDQLD
jgi:hypothetical protein